MDNTSNIEAELQVRIQAEISTFQGTLPERYALAWHGYLAGLVEWKVIDFDTYGKLIRLLPKLSLPNPIDTIFLGRD